MCFFFGSFRKSNRRLLWKLGWRGVSQDFQWQLQEPLKVCQQYLYWSSSWVGNLFFFGLWVFRKSWWGPCFVRSLVVCLQTQRYTVYVDMIWKRQKGPNISKEGLFRMLFGAKYLLRRYLNPPNAPSNKGTQYIHDMFLLGCSKFNVSFSTGTLRSQVMSIGRLLPIDILQAFTYTALKTAGSRRKVEVPWLRGFSIAKAMKQAPFRNPRNGYPWDVH